MLDPNIDAESNIQKFITEYRKATPAMRVYLEDAVRSNVVKYLTEGLITQQQHDESQKGIDEMVAEAQKGVQ